MGNAGTGGRESGPSPGSPSQPRSGECPPTPPPAGAGWAGGGGATHHAGEPELLLDGVGAEAARDVRVRDALDLDHVRALIGQERRRPGAGDNLGEVQHADAREGSGPGLARRLGGALVGSGWGGAQVLGHGAQPLAHRATRAGPAAHCVCDVRALIEQQLLPALPPCRRRPHCHRRRRSLTLLSSPAPTGRRGRRGD